MTLSSCHCWNWTCDQWLCVVAVDDVAAGHADAGHGDGDDDDADDDVAYSDGCGVWAIHQPRIHSSAGEVIWRPMMVETPPWSSPPLNG